MNDQTHRQRILAIIEEMQYRTSAASTLEEMRDIRAKYGQRAAWMAAGVVADPQAVDDWRRRDDRTLPRA